MFRYLFGWLQPIKHSFLKLTQAEAVKKIYENTQVFQDLMVPTSKMTDSLRAIDRLLKVYPLWLCPFRLWNDPGLLRTSDGLDTDVYVDVGIYGTVRVKRNEYHVERTMHELEDIVVKFNGFQMLYGDTYRTRDEFRQMFDHGLYDQVRKQYKCKEAFPEIYDKVNKKVRD